MDSHITETQKADDKEIMYVHIPKACAVRRRTTKANLASILEYNTLFLDFLPPLYVLIKRTVPPVFFPGKLGGSSNQFNEEGGTGLRLTALIHRLLLFVKRRLTSVNEIIFWLGTN